MANNVRVILLEDVESLGKAGNIVLVSEGYARNFLFPGGRAALASVGDEKKDSERKSSDSAKEATKIKQLQDIADQLDGTELIIMAKVKEGTDIYGSISAMAVAKALSEQTALKLAARDIRLKGPIKETGSFDATVKLADDVEFKIKITVEGEQSGEEN